MTVTHDQPQSSRHLVDAPSPGLSAALRITAGLLWLSNINWKAPPGFGKSERGCGGLCGFVRSGTEHGFPGWSWLLDHLVLPQLTLFGYVTLLIEASLAVLSLSGTLTRGAALLGAVQSVVIGLSVANAPGEWYWSYLLMAALHVAVFTLAAGRAYGVDAMLRRRPVRPRWLDALT